MKRKSPPPVIWPADRVALLTEMVAAGELSRMRIAEALNVSKSTVAGKVNRLGISGPRSAGPRHKPKPPQPVGGPFPGPGRCVWPQGHPTDRDFHFCGAPAEIGRPYCATHYDRAHLRGSAAA